MTSYKKTQKKLNTQLNDLGVFIDSCFQLVKLTEKMGFKQRFESVNIAAGTENIRETVPNTGCIKDKCSLTMGCLGSKSTFF